MALENASGPAPSIAVRPALSDVCQKLQSTIKARFAAAIGPGHDIEWIERDPDVAQRTIAGDLQVSSARRVGLDKGVRAG